MLSKISSKMLPSVLELHESQERVKMATASLIRHSMNPGMMIRELSGEYTGKTRELDPILEKYINPEDLRHMKRILTQGCPFEIDYKEDTARKMELLSRGNQNSFKDFPEIVHLTLNKEERFSHVLPLEDWSPHFLASMRLTPQGLNQ